MSQHTFADAMWRAELRLDVCRKEAPPMHSRLWKEVFIHRYEWHVEWRDYGRTVTAAVTKKFSTGERS